MAIRSSTIVDNTGPCSVTVHVWDDGTPGVGGATVDITMEIEPRITQFDPAGGHTAGYSPAPPNTFITWRGVVVPAAPPTGVNYKANIAKKAGVDVSSTTVFCIVSGTLNAGGPYYESMQAVMVWP